MLNQIDWISFTVEVDILDDLPQHRLWRHLQQFFFDLMPESYQTFLLGRRFDPTGVRAPYSQAWTFKENRIVIMAHPRLPHAVIEISGQGCRWLEDRMDIRVLLREIGGRLTRLDISSDMLTDETPDKFVQLRAEGRWKAFSEVKSQTGHTIYIGSRQSDRYCRVYRYYEPHPRSKFLRCEFVLKSEQARVICDELLEDGLIRTVSALGRTFGWNHPAWQPGSSSEEEARSWSPERRQGKTVRWVHSQVIPALVKLHEEGIVDVRLLFEESILPKLSASPETDGDGLYPPVE